MTTLSRIPANHRRAAALAGNPVWRALNAKPITQPEQVDLALAARSAFDDITHGRGCDEHLDTLACAANVSLVLAERGYGPECEGKIKDAQQALLRMRARQQQGKHIGVDGPGAQALRDLLDTHEQQIQHAGRAEVSNALLEVHRRMAQGHVFRTTHQPT